MQICPKLHQKVHYFHENLSKIVTKVQMFICIVSEQSNTIDFY